MSSAEESYEDDYEDDEYTQNSGSEVGHAEVSTKFDSSFNFYCVPFSRESLTSLRLNLQADNIQGNHNSTISTRSSEIPADNRVERYQEKNMVMIENGSFGDNTNSPPDNPTTTLEDQQTEAVDSSFMTDEDLMRRLYESSRRLVQEGEKHVSLALELDKTRDLLRSSRNENEELRTLLLEGINGGTADTNNYENVALTYLLRIRLQEVGSVCAVCSSASHSFGHCKKMSKQSDLISLHSNLTQQKSEKDSTRGVKNSKECDCERIKGELNRMGDRFRRDREIKHKLNKCLDDEKCKVNALSDHIEKLMIHLKHEAITKAKALGERTKHQKEIEMLKEQNQILEKRNGRKDQAINDLKEGGKVLEDQLTLMDEKYMELRMKLDWSRNQMEKVLRKKDEEVKELRLQSLLAEKSKKSVLRKQQIGRNQTTVDNQRNQRAPKTANLLSLRPKLPSTSDGVT